MTGLFAGLWLFGGLLSGDVTDCVDAAQRAAHTIEAIEQQWPLRSSSDPVSAYVQALGQRLAGSASGSDDPVRIYVLRNLQPSAFALGGRRFVVSDGLIALIREESELAAVLAHEIAHDELGHFCRDASSATRRFRVGSVVQHFDLDLEMAADAAAVEKLITTGYEPQAMYAVLRCLAQHDSNASSQLNKRMRALQGPSTRPVFPRPRRSGDFERIRRLVLDDLPGGGARCR